jgi:DNA-binding response OmpR family regulator
MNTEIQRVLVVHQQREILEKIAGELEKKGYIVSIATNGIDGMFAGFYEKFHMILSAMDLPKLTGFEMVRTLQSRSYNNGVPVIFIGTGLESAETIALASKLNAVIMPLPAITNSINTVDEAIPLSDVLSPVRINRTSR